LDQLYDEQSLIPLFSQTEANSSLNLGPYALSPPKYPSPWIEGIGDWAASFARAQDLVRQMTLLEKVNLTTGTGWESEACVGSTGAIPRLGFPSLCLQDAPLGVRFADYVSAFPAGGTVAAAWDRSLWYQRGVDMGSEHRDKGVDM
jgi:beta-glucosidase